MQVQAGLVAAIVTAIVAATIIIIWDKQLKVSMRYYRDSSAWDEEPTVDYCVCKQRAAENASTNSECHTSSTHSTSTSTTATTTVYDNILWLSLPAISSIPAIPAVRRGSMTTTSAE